jgi:integrase
VNLATGTLTIRQAKTDAGVRRVDLPLALREELSDHKARSKRTGPGDPVFINRNGDRQTVSNIGRRLKTVLRRADSRLVDLGLEPMGEAVTPYSFRRLYASLRYALGDDPVYVAEQMGHADAGGLSMGLYARAVKRREQLAAAALQEFDRALQWAEMGRIEPAAEIAPIEPQDAATLETAPQSHNLRIGPDSSAG